MDSNSFSVPVSLLRQYAFCPRIPFFKLLYPASGVNPIWTKQGNALHDYASLLMKRRSLSRFGLQGSYQLRQQVCLKSSLFSMHGICDALLVLEGKDYFVIEYKLSAPSVSLGTNLQLAAYAMMVEEHFHVPSRRAFVLVGKRGKTIPISIDEQLRTTVTRTITAIKRDCERGILPFSNASEPQCNQCEFLNFCADRL